MKSLLFYLLQMIIASGILYGYYHLALRNKKFHQYNRFYLLAAFIISVLVPFINIPVYFSNAETDSSFILQTLTSFSSSDSEQAATPIIYTPTVKTNWLNWQNLTYFIYIAIALIVLFRIFISLRRIRFIIQNNSVERLENIHFVNTNEPGTPFSFFRWLFWNRQIELDSDKGGQIFRHELFHIKQGHSRDILFIEVLMVFFWINPFFYLMKKEVKAIHEFLADKFAIQESGHWEYAELLLMQAFNTKQHLVNPFFHNQIRRRIAMITSSPKPGHQYLRKLMVLPIVAVVIVLFAFVYKTKQDLVVTPHPVEEHLISDTVQTPKLSPVKGDLYIKYYTTRANNIRPSISSSIKDFGFSDTSKPVSEEKLIIIDGKEQVDIKSLKDLDERIKLSDIESINILKGPSAVFKYGEKGRNGAIEISTKKKNDSKVKDDTISKNIFDPLAMNFDDPEFKRKWREMISEIKAIAWKEGKAAYEYRGRTYIFGQIKNPDSTIAAFTEQNGTGHVFLLNGKLIKSVNDLNALITRNDVIRFGFINETEALNRFNRKEAIVSIETSADHITKS